MKQSENIRHFFSRVSTIVNQIQCLRDNIQDKNVVEKIFRTLPLKFDHCVAVIEESKDLSKLSTFELMSSLHVHEQRIYRSSNQSIEQAFQSNLASWIVNQAKPILEKELFRRTIKIMEEAEKDTISMTKEKKKETSNKMKNPDLSTLFEKGQIIIHKIAAPV